MSKFRFIVIEGIDGSGKTSLQEGLADYIQKQGTQVYQFHEPGSTSVGEKIRTLVKREPVDPRVTHLLIEASRLDLLLVIQDLLPQSFDEVFIVDRHVDSSWAYQGATGVNGEYIDQVQSTYSDLPQPDITIYLDIDPAVAMERTRNRVGATGHLDFFDSKDVDFFAQVRLKYWERISKNPGRYFVVDGAQSKEAVLHQVVNFIESTI